MRDSGEMSDRAEIAEGINVMKQRIEFLNE
jgi:hypothetical protein